MAIWDISHQASEQRMSYGDTFDGPVYFHIDDVMTKGNFKMSNMVVVPRTEDMVRVQYPAGSGKYPFMVGCLVVKCYY